MRKNEFHVTKPKNIALGMNATDDRNQNDFIMLPTVDFCFKELMQNEKVRKGMIAAILGIRLEEREGRILRRWQRRILK